MLFDMLDGFANNMKIDTSFNWSKYEQERPLNKKSMLKYKYLNE